MDVRRTVHHAPDISLLIVVLTLCVFGLLMVFSASMSQQGSTTYFFLHQLLAFGLGLVAMFVGYSVDYRIWRDLAYPSFIVAAALLLAVLLFGKESGGGSKRWLFSSSLQPSEFAKLAVIFFAAKWLPRKGDDVRSLSYGLAPFAVIVGIIVALIKNEPDLGTSLVVLATAGGLFLIAGADLIQLLVAGGLVAVVLRLAAAGYQEDRLNFFWDPCSGLNPKLDQVCQGIAALGSGGLTGLGLGSSRWRWVLPIPYSDSVLGIIGEELGLIGVVFLLSLFMLLAYRGFRIGLRTPDAFGRLVATGITLWLVLQACVNFGGNTALLPFTGEPLPFISYGGSALVVAMGSVGILLNISRQTQEVGALTKGPLQRIPHAPIANRWGDSGARVPGAVGRRGAASTASRPVTGLGR